MIEKMIKIWQRITGQRVIGATNKEANVIKDYTDERDHLASTQKFKEQSVNHRQYTGIVKNQGSTNSCTAQAATTVYLAHLLKKEPGLIKVFNKHINKYDFSERFNYYYSREMNGLLPMDKGSYTRSAMKVMHKLGSVSDSLCPFNLDSLNLEPLTIANSFASLFKIKSYYRLNNLNDMKSEVINKGPFVLAIPIFRNFQRLRTNKTPTTKGDRYVGRHAMAVIGYNPKHGFLLQNSWGTRWGSGGFAWLPPTYFNDIKSKGFDAWGIVVE